MHGKGFDNFVCERSSQNKNIIGPSACCHCHILDKLISGANEGLAMALLVVGEGCVGERVRLYFYLYIYICNASP